MKAIRHLWPGLIVVVIFASCARALADAGLVHCGIGALTLAILSGAVCGNLWPALAQGERSAGIGFAQQRLLRLGVALYGFNLGVQQVMALGISGMTIDVTMVASTLGLGWFLGRYWLKLDPVTTLLTSAGSAICGAAAVVATIPFVDSGAKPAADKAASAIATVVLFGTLAMLVYPLIFAIVGDDRRAFGLYVGSTVHEVAQVVAIGSALGESAAQAAIVAKMLRVALLVPFLFGVGILFRRSECRTGGASIKIPWFALGFLACAALHSTGLVPKFLIGWLQDVGNLLLTAAMAALGLTTTVSRMRSAGIRPFILGLCLFAHLTVTGWAVNHWLR